MQRIAFFLLAIVALGLASCSPQPGAAPSAAEPTTQPVAPTDTLIPPTNPATQPAAPADTAVPPTDAATQPPVPTDTLSPLADPATVAPSSSPTVEVLPSPTSGPSHVPATDLAIDAADVVLHPGPVV